MTNRQRPGNTRQPIEASLKDVDAWWTVLVIDPLALRVLPHLLRWSWATPNALTLMAGTLGLCSGAAFLSGAPVVGAALFELRFFFDCLDGKVARLRGGGSAVGGFLDRSIDIVIMAWAYCTLGLWLGRHGSLPAGLSLLPAVVALLWAWSSQYLGATRRDVASSVGRPVSPGSGPRRLLRGRRLTRLPGSVEATTLTLFLAPLTASRAVMVAALWVVTTAFFLPATAHNFYSAARLLRRVDQEAAA